jgi:hypothetical protein
MKKEVRAEAKLKESDIIHLYHGGVIILKINGKDADASVELSRSDIPERRGTRILLKDIRGE